MADPVYTLGIELVSGSFTNVTSYVLRASVDRAISDVANGIVDGQLLATLDNGGAQFSPLNAGSPYYPDLKVGRRVSLSATYGGSDYQIFNGRIRDIRVQPNQSRQTALVEAVDDIARLPISQAQTGLLINTNPASAFCAVMSNTGVASFSADLLADSLPYAWFNDISCAEAMRNLIESGGYQMYADTAGAVRLKSRYWGITGASVASYNEFADLAFGLAGDDVRNSIRISAQSRKPSASVSTIAWLQSPVTVPASGGAGFWLAYVDPDVPTQPTPANSVATPVSSTDWKVNASSDGLGADLTATCSLIFTAFGATAVASIFNGTPTQGYVTKFQVNGFSLQQTPPVTIQTDDSSSAGVYGKKTLAITDDLLYDPAFLGDYSNFLLRQYKEPPGKVQMAIQNIWPDCLARDLADIVSPVNSVTSINSAWTVSRISHQIELGAGLQHTTKCDLKFYPFRDWFVLDDPVQGVLDAGNRLGF